MKFYSGINKKAWEKIWSKGKFDNRLTNVATDHYLAEGFSFDGTIIEIDAPINSIVGVREEDYRDDMDWIDVSKYSNNDKKNLLYEYEMFLLNLKKYKSKVKIKLYKGRFAMKTKYFKVVAKLDEDGVDIQAEIMRLFKQVKIDNVDTMIQFADGMGMSIEEFAQDFINILTSFFHAGRALEKNINIEDVDQEELKMGIKVEMEHTTDPRIAMRIALDHLSELPDYYTRLDKMESDAGVKY